MSTGALLYPIGYVFLDDNGAPVNAGKVYFSRTGTSTAQDTYSDSTLDTANANPVVLNSAGRATTAIYGDPSSGFDYRIVLKTSALATIWTYDDVVVAGADAATLAEGSFTATITGCGTDPTGTVNYIITANAAGTGKICRLYTVSAISAESDATAMTMTGIPAACVPGSDVNVSCNVLDNAVGVQAGMTIAADAATATFFCDTPLSATGFTSSGVKGLPAGWQAEYAL